ncbi:MAG TPA: hypothetical protein DIC18_02675 [Clostridiales bacterium]|nr:hypothetical protein [Clostridiales bacterium]
MKRVFALLLIIALLCLLSAGLFACDENGQAVTLSQEELALQCVNAAFPAGEDNASVATSLLSLFKEAGLEQAEMRTALLALKEHATEIGEALLALKNNDFSEEGYSLYRPALQVVADSVSPDVAGSVFYTVANRLFEELPYTKEDCKKLASLLLGQDAAFGTSLLDSLLAGELSSIGERQITTALYGLSASLRAAVGISNGAKETLRSFLNSIIENYSAEEETDPDMQEVVERSKNLLTSLSDLLVLHYDELLTYGAEYLSVGGARALLGLPYEKQERTLYYGYLYSEWEATLISEEQYQAREGGYDEYLSLRRIVSGFTVNGQFLYFTDEETSLANKVYRLYAAIRAYDAVSDEKQTALLAAFNELLSAFTDEQDLLSSLLDKELIEEVQKEPVSQNEMLAALRSLSSFDATDGLTEKEKADALSSIAVFEGYLHAYLPKIF